MGCGERDRPRGGERALPPGGGSGERDLPGGGSGERDLPGGGSGDRDLPRGGGGNGERDRPPGGGIGERDRRLSIKGQKISSLVAVYYIQTIYSQCHVILSYYIHTTK